MMRAEVCIPIHRPRDFAMKFISCLHGIERTSSVILTAGCNFQTLFDTFGTALSEANHSAEGEVLQNVLQLCLDETEEGGLQLSPTGTLTEQDIANMSFLVDAWLESLNSAARVSRLPEPIKERRMNRRLMTLTEKIFAHHASSVPTSAGVRPGDLLRVAVDWIIASEVSWSVGTGVY
jgi:hypothetical protein